MDKFVIIIIFLMILLLFFILLRMKYVNFIEKRTKENKKGEQK